MEDRVVHRREVWRMIGVSRSKLFAMEASGEFPKRMEISAGIHGWMLSTVKAWLASRPNYVAFAEAPTTSDSAAAKPEKTLPALQTALEAWEDELDMLGPFASSEQLREHLARAPGASEMVTFLKGYLAARGIEGMP